jgi:hypothetical protein
MDRKTVFIKREIDGITFMGHIADDGPCIARAPSAGWPDVPIGPYTRIKDLGGKKERKWVSEWWIVLQTKPMIPLAGLSNSGINSLSESFGLPIEQFRVTPESMKEKWLDTFWGTDAFDELSRWSSKHRQAVRSLSRRTKIEKYMPWIKFSQCEVLPLKDRVAVARGRRTPEPVMKRLSKDRSPSVRVAVAESSSNGLLLHCLAKDGSPMVRRAVAANRFVSISELSVVFTQDTNASVRKQAKASLHIACKR